MVHVSVSQEGKGFDCNNVMSMVHVYLSLGGMGSTVLVTFQCFMSLLVFHGGVDCNSALSMIHVFVSLDRRGSTVLVKFQWFMSI